MSVTVKNIISLPAMALRGVVVFPEMFVHFDVGRPKSVEALRAAMESDRRIFLITQRDMREEEVGRDGLYDVGVVAKVRQMLKLPEGGLRVLVEGVCRAECVNLRIRPDYMIADVNRIEDKKPRCSAIYREALVRRAREVFEDYAEVNAKVPPDIVMTVLSNDNIGYLADYIASNTTIQLDDKQFILEQSNPQKRLEAVISLLIRETEILKTDEKIGREVAASIDDNQREYYMREQLKVLNEELYGGDDPNKEADEYNKKIDALKASDEVKEKLKAEVSHLAKMPPGSQEATVVRGYLDCCISLPWGIYSKEKINIAKSRKILDRDHYGLKKIKERMIELLSVRSLNPDIKGQIVCLAGPPGIGKTSIARAVAECMGRKYARVALGGVGDEAEIRGHRKTYIGSMPGRIIDAIKKAGTSNPLILLDEVDKLADSYKGSPASALLEVLDSEQNSAFVDHYIDLPFDLSRVLFITTANSLGTVPRPLLDRMEIIEMGSYTREDKFHIAKNHLIKKQTAEHGLTAKQLKITDAAIYEMIDGYTKEAGVRQLDRTIAAICRKAAVKIVSGESEAVNVGAKALKELLGTPKYRDEKLSAADEIGLVNGLAWTAVGGTMMKLEAVAVPGSGKLELTGSLGDVMRESAKAAVTYVRSRAEALGIDRDFYKNRDLHIHADEAAVPKDGPSAGVTMTTAVVSSLTGIPVRRDIAMTGEITIRGTVCAIGGLKEKSMAAFKSGVAKIFIPADNVPDLDEVDEVVKSAVEFIPVKNIDEILRQALTENPFLNETHAAKLSYRIEPERKSSGVGLR